MSYHHRKALRAPLRHGEVVVREGGGHTMLGVKNVYLELTAPAVVAVGKRKPGAAATRARRAVA